MRRMTTVREQTQRSNEDQYLKSIRSNSIVVKKISTIVEGGISITCEICYTTKPPKDFIKLNCDHAFCVDCLYDSFKYYILRGEVDKVVCAAP